MKKSNIIILFIIIVAFLVGCVKENPVEPNQQNKEKIVVKKKIAALFQVDKSATFVNTELQFIDKSKDVEGKIVEWKWIFGDGLTSTEKDPIHTFESTGKYTVELNVKGQSGEVDVFSMEIAIVGVQWEFQTGAEIKSSSPVIGNDGTIYIGSYDSKIYAINPNGSEKWSYTTGGKILSSPSIGSDGTIYCGSADKKLYAFDDVGNLKWEYLTSGKIIYSTPAIGSDGTIYFGSDSDSLYALNSDGSLKWAVQTSGNVRSHPSIGSDGTIYFASDDKKFRAVNPENGSVSWELELGGKAQSGAAIGADGTIYIGADLGGTEGKVFAINPNGSEKWSLATVGRISVCSPSIGIDGNIYIGTKEGHNLLALNASDGSVAWEFKTPDAIVNSSPAVGGNGTIYFGSWDDNVYALNPDGTLKFKFLTGGNVWSSPVISNFVLYVGSYDGKLYAIDASAEGLAKSAWPMVGHDAMHSGRITNISSVRDYP